MTPRDYTTRTVDGARAHAAQFAEPEPVELLGWAEPPPDAEPEEGAAEDPASV